jgi:hypothetical protein
MGGSLPRDLWLFPRTDCSDILVINADYVRFDYLNVNLQRTANSMKQAPGFAGCKSLSEFAIAP